MNMSSFGNIASELQLEAPKNPTQGNEKRPTKYAVVYWIETKEFNVMPLSKIPKDERGESFGDFKS